MNMSTTLTSNVIAHSEYVRFIRLLIQIHKFRKILIIFINDSSDSNQSTFAVLVVDAFTKKEERKR